MVRNSMILFIAFLFFGNANAQINKLYLPEKYQVQNGLKVSTNKRYLVDAVTAEPVFLLATTAWNINALTYSEIDTLLKSVANNGFNSIMFAINFYPQADEPNVYSDKPYIGTNKTDLNPAYFVYCDSIVKKCSQYGLYAMLYTMWSGKTTGIMNNYTAEQLYILGKKIGVKYQNFKNVILVAGGESSPPYIDIVSVNAMGNGLKDGCKNDNLVTVHPCSPHSNSEYYANANWLDFYMTQGKSNINGIAYDLTKAITKDYANTITKPTMVAEHRYESGITEDAIIQRRSLYLSVFSGGFGYAYGHNALWQMTPHTAQPWMLKSWKAGVTDWKQALNTPAQQQLHFIKQLLAAYPYLSRVPDKSLVTTAHNNDSIYSMVKVMRDGEIGSNNATYIMSYLSSPQSIIIKTDVIRGKKLNAYWFNPRTGLSNIILKDFKNSGTFIPPIKTDNQDWVIVVEDGVAFRNKLSTKQK